MSTPKIICESVFLSEAKVISSPKSSDKVIIETYLQEAETPNDNNRIYPKDVIGFGLDKINDRYIKKRQFLGELDHPISNNQIRQTTVLYKECSHVITEYGWEGNLLKGTVETLPYTPNGKIMSGLVRDKIPVGFSLRALADVSPHGQYKKVKGPMIIITYDCVSKPSNHKAYMTEVKQESVTVLRESANAICTSDGICYLPNYFDMLVEQKLIDLKKKYW